MHDPRLPDGGFGWVIVAACFLANTLLVGMPRSFGVIYIVLIEKFETSATETAWVHALFNTMRMVFGPLSSLSCEKWGCRPVVMFGGLLVGIGVMCMAFATNIYWVYLTYGMLAGFGGAFIFTPTLIVIGQYFSKRKGIAMAISTLGSGLGTLLFAPLFNFLFATYGYFGASVVVGAIMLNCIVSGALLRPVDEYLKPVATMEMVVKEDGVMDKQQVCTVLNGADFKEIPQSGDKKSQNQNVLQLTSIELQDKDRNRTKASSMEKGDHSLKESGAINGVGKSLLNHDTAINKKEESGNPTTNAANNLPSCHESHESYEKIDPTQNSAESHTDLLQKPTVLSTTTNSDPNSQDQHDSKSSLSSSDESNCKSRCVSRLSLFWNLLFMLYAFNILCMPFCIQTIYLFLPRYATENDVDKTTGAWIVAAMGTSSTVGRFVLGLAFDTKWMRHRRRFLHAIIGIFFGLASSGIGLFKSVWPMTLFAVLSGFFEGGFHGQRATVLSEMVRPALLDLSVGYMIFAQGIGNTLGPVGGGMIRDYTGTYSVVFFLGGLLFAASSLIMLVHYLLTGNDKAMAGFDPKKK